MSRPELNTKDLHHLCGLYEGLATLCAVADGLAGPKLAEGDLSCIIRSLALAPLDALRRDVIAEIEARQPTSPAKQEGRALCLAANALHSRDPRMLMDAATQLVRAMHGAGLEGAR